MSQFLSDLFTKATSALITNQQQIESFATPYQITSYQSNSATPSKFSVHTINTTYSSYLKKLKHPYILKYIDNNTTEYCIPLIHYKICEKEKAYLIYCIKQAVEFIHTSGLRHGLITKESIFVTESEFKLAGFFEMREALPEDKSKDLVSLRKLEVEFQSNDLEYVEIAKKLENVQVNIDYIPIESNLIKAKIILKLKQSLEFNLVSVDKLPVLIQYATEVNYNLFDLIYKLFPNNKEVILSNFSKLSFAKDEINKIWPIYISCFLIRIDSLLHIISLLTESQITQVCKILMSSADPIIIYNSVVLFAKINKYIKKEFLLLHFLRNLSSVSIQGLIVSIDKFNCEDLCRIIQKVSMELNKEENYGLVLKLVNLCLERIKVEMEPRIKEFNEMKQVEMQKKKEEELKKINEVKMRDKQENTSNHEITSPGVQKQLSNLSLQETVKVQVTSLKLTSSKQDNGWNFDEDLLKNDDFNSVFNNNSSKPSPLSSSDFDLKPSGSSGSLFGQTETNVENESNNDILQRKKEERRSRIEALKQQRRNNK